jgi:hypothetical protein
VRCKLMAARCSQALSSARRADMDLIVTDLAQALTVLFDTEDLAANESASSAAAAVTAAAAASEQWPNHPSVYSASAAPCCFCCDIVNTY